MSPRARRFVRSAFYFVLALLTFHGLARMTAHFQAGTPAKPRLAPPEPKPAAGVAAETGASEERGYVRSLKVSDVPMPGAERPAPVDSRRADASATTPAQSPAAAFARNGLSPGLGALEFPSGGSAPTATSRPAPVQVPPEERTRAPQGGAPSKSETPAKAGGKEVRPPAEGDGGFPVDGRLSAATSGVLAAAKKQKADASANSGLFAPHGLGTQLLRGIALDNKIDAELRSAVDRLRDSGTATPDALQQAAAGIIAANGGSSEPDDIERALARAAAPPSPPISPAAYAAAARQILSGPPLTPAQEAEIKENVEHPPRPRGPAPRSAIQAFAQNRDVFDKAQQEYGVQPQHILGILGVESDYGRGDMGKLDAGQTLLTLIKNYPGQARGRQAEADLKALGRLKAADQLGGTTPKVNWAGAMGIPQFLFSSWENLGVGVGSKRDPLNMGDSILSVANYLRHSGYSKDVRRSILAYNHSDPYADKVLGVAANVEPAIRAAKQSPDTAPAAVPAAPPK